MLNIVVLDSFVTAMQDLNWNKFKKLGNLEVYENTLDEDIVSRAINADVILTNKVPLKAQQLKDLPRLKYIGVLATGYNNVDLIKAREQNVDITNVPDYGKQSIAQATFAHILNISNRLSEHMQAVNEGKWQKHDNIALVLKPISDLDNKMLGIIGYGSIGKSVAKLAKAFEMNVIAYSPSKKIGDNDEFANFVSLEDIFKNSDIISLNCPLNEKTNQIINKENIKICKDNVWIINTARGGVICESDVLEAVKSGKISAFACDVLSEEPPKNGNILIGQENIFISPHNAWTSKGSRGRIIDIAYDNLQAWINKNARNIVN